MCRSMGFTIPTCLVPSDGYKNRVTPGWLSLLVNAGEGIDIDFFLQKQPKDKIQQRLGQQIRTPVPN